MMNLPFLLIDSLHLIGVALLHFLWQGMLIGILYALARKILPRGQVRYWLGVVALTGLLLCPALTMMWLVKTPSPVAFDQAAAVPMIVVTSRPEDVSSFGLYALTGQAGLTPWLTVVWLAGVLLLSLRVWRQWRGLKRLVASGFKDDGPMWLLLHQMSRRFGLHRHVGLVWSDVAAAPLLVGWFRPVIVLPLVMASGFPRSQLELILAHELAHLRRLDPWVNFFPVILETLFFFHPVVHWISADVRNEREICCDQMALAVHGGNWRDLARALSSLGGMQQVAPMILAANGGVLLDRVRQMAADHGVVATQPSRPYSGALLALGMVATLVLGLTLKRESGVPDLMGPIPRVASWVVMPLASSLRQAWQPVDLKPSSAPLQRPVTAEDDSIAIALPGARDNVTIATSLPLTVENLAPRRAIPPLTRLREVEIASQMLTPLRIRQPIYPAVALERGIEGKVAIEFSLSDNGMVQDLRVESAEPVGVFEQAALLAMRGWVYSVPRGRRISERYRQVMVFSLNEGNEGGSREIHARIGCQVVIGTHICRLPEEAARQDAVEPSGV